MSEQQLTRVCTAAIPLKISDDHITKMITPIFLRQDGFLHPEFLNELDFLTEAACLANPDMYDPRYSLNIRVQRIKQALTTKEVKWND